MNKKTKSIFSVLALSIALFASGCSQHQSPTADVTTDTGAVTSTENVAKTVNEKDPYESFNRKMFAFNTTLDDYVLRPIAEGYSYLPNPVKTGVTNVFSNLGEPRNAINNLLQGKAEDTGNTVMRFLVNSTFGLAGILDIATPIGLEKKREDFGQTLATWGVAEGPYLMLPLFGPRFARHAVAFIPDGAANPTNYIDEGYVTLGTRVLDIVQTRERFLGLDDTLELQLDPYVFIRESYIQRRHREIGGENQGQSGFDEFDDFEDFEDAENLEQPTAN